MADAGKGFGKNLYITIDSVDLSAYCQEVTGLPGEVELGDTTAGNATGYSFLPGLQKAEGTIKLVFQQGASKPWNTLSGYQTWAAAKAVVFCPAGNTSGYPKYTCSIWVKSIDMSVTPAGLLIMNVNYVVDGAITITTV